MAQRTSLKRRLTNQRKISSEENFCELPAKFLVPPIVENSNPVIMNAIFWQDEHLICHTLEWMSVQDALSLTQVNFSLCSLCSNAEVFWKHQFHKKWSISDTSWRGNHWKMAYLDALHSKNELWTLHSRWMSVTLFPKSDPLASGTFDPDALGSRINCHHEGYMLQSERVGLIQRQQADTVNCAAEAKRDFNMDPTDHRTCDVCLGGSVEWGPGLHFLKDIIFSSSLMTVCSPFQCVWLANPSKVQPVAYRFVTCRPDLYSIRPAAGFLLPGQALEVVVYVCPGQMNKAQRWAALSGLVCPKTFVLQYTNSTSLRRYENAEGNFSFSHLLSDPEEASGIRTIPFNVHHTTMPLEVNSSTWEGRELSRIQRCKKEKAEQPEICFRNLFQQKWNEEVMRVIREEGPIFTTRTKMRLKIKVFFVTCASLEISHWGYLAAAFLAPTTLAPFCWHAIAGPPPDEGLTPEEATRLREEARRFVELLTYPNRSPFKPLWDLLTGTGGYDVLVQGYARCAFIWVIMSMSCFPVIFSCLLRCGGKLDLQLPGIISVKNTNQSMFINFEALLQETVKPEIEPTNLQYASTFWCYFGVFSLLCVWGFAFQIGERRLKRWTVALLLPIIGAISFQVASPNPYINSATVVLQGGAVAMGTFLYDAEMGVVIDHHSLRGGIISQSIIAFFSRFLPFSCTGLFFPTAAPAASYFSFVILLGQLLGCTGDARFVVEIWAVLSCFIGVPVVFRYEVIHWKFLALYSSLSWLVYTLVRRGVAMNLKNQTVSVAGVLGVILLVAAWITLFVHLLSKKIVYYGIILLFGWLVFVLIRKLYDKYLTHSKHAQSSSS